MVVITSDSSPAAGLGIERKPGPRTETCLSPEVGKYSWGCIIVGRALVQHVGGPSFYPQHHISQCWCMPAISALRRWKQEDQKFKAFLCHTEFEANLGYMRAFLKKKKITMAHFIHPSVSLQLGECESGGWRRDEELQETSMPSVCSAHDGFPAFPLPTGCREAL